MKNLVLIGYGAIAREVVARLPTGIRLAGVVLPAALQPALRAELGPAVPLHASVAELAPADLVLECAGHAGLAEHGAAVLERGGKLAVMSVGALADSALHQQLCAAAARGGGHLQLLSGALGGLDALAAAREGGLDEVLYSARKAPASWRGSPAEQWLDLAAVREPTIFFEGSAGEAARLFPANANVAAAVALHGLGLEATRVQLSVDPGTARNRHQIYARGAFGELRVELAGAPLERNPKTSMLAALSAVRACRELLS